MISLVRVNLLPPELEERARQRRKAGYAGAGVAVWIVLLGMVYGLKAAEVNHLEQVRADEQAQVSQLQAEVATLAQFRQLASDLENKNTQLSTAMATEISWARVLNDMSLAFPANASLQTFSAKMQDPAASAAAPGEVAVGEAVASVEFGGYSVEQFAPGVEAVLLEFSKIRSFHNVFLGTAAEGEIGSTEVTNFTGSSLMDDQAYTDRYEAGLPAEDAP